MRISYITDIEGDLEHWNHFCLISKILSRNSTGLIELAEGAHFVFGGDAQDRQSGDLAVIRNLLSLKKRYPDRVHLLMGNRDINKLRLLLELSEEHAAAVPLASHPGVYWWRDGRPEKTLGEEEVTTNSLATRLRWILRHTMGAEDAFEYRREELSRADPDTEVSDAEVVESFLSSVRPDGLAFEYLKQSELAVLLGDTLFVHAGLPRVGMEWVPGWVPGPPARQGLPLKEWIAELSSLSRTSLDEVASAVGSGSLGTEAWSSVGGYVHTQPGCRLMQYGMRDLPDGGKQPSIIYNGWLDDDYQPLRPDAATLAWLKAGGVQRVVSGHKPNGESPLIMRPDPDLDIITADCCYAGVIARPGAPEPKEEAGKERGRAVCEVLLEPERRTQIHGRLGDGTAFEAALDDDAIGCVDADGWRVKGRVEGQLLLSRNTNWNFETKLADSGDIKLQNATA